MAVGTESEWHSWQGNEPIWQPESASDRASSFVADLESSVAGGQLIGVSRVLTDMSVHIKSSSYRVRVELFSEDEERGPTLLTEAKKIVDTMALVGSGDHEPGEDELVPLDEDAEEDDAWKLGCSYSFTE